MTSPYHEACRVWLDPSKAKVIGKADLLSHGAVPSPTEEATLRGILESASIPEEEWGGVCLLADRIRTHAATQGLQDEASEQIAHAERFLDLGREDFLRWPWRDLDGLVGGMGPGTLHFVVCPSKGGKTTLCRSATAHWIRDGKRIYYAGFEMTAPILRTMYAADEVGIDPGDVVSGAWTHFEHHGVLKERMRAAYRGQDAPDSPYQNLRFSSVTDVTKQDIERMMGQAADWGADAFIIDHIDHIDSSKGGDYTGAQSVVHALNRLAQQYELPVVITSQMNTTDKSRNLWRDHRDLRQEYVKYGQLKLEVATTMVGLYRPLRPGMVKEDRQRVEAGERTVWDYVWPSVNAVNLLASRPYGSRIGQRALLGWERGRIVDAPQDVQHAAQAAQHGIRTNRD